MNKKGTGQIAAIFLFIFFVINWFIWLGKWLADIGRTTIETNSLTGIEAFMYANLNFWVLICMLLGMMGWMYLTTE